MLDTVMTWSEAAAASLFKYRYKNRCRRGHEPIRYVKSNCCVECTKLPYHKRCGRDGQIHTGSKLALPNTRDEAIAKGDIKYLNKKSCRKGHPPIRYTNSGACVACVAGYSKKNQPTRLTLWAHADDIDLIKKYAQTLAAIRDLGI